jgi:Mn2+/Fe2+ NRAMP family transporter
VWLVALVALVLVLYAVGGSKALLQLGAVLALVILPFAFGVGLQFALGDRHIPS